MEKQSSSTLPSGVPRRIPLPVLATLLFGGRKNFTAWIILGLSMILLFEIDLIKNLMVSRLFRGELETTKGTVLDSKKDRIRVGYRNEVYKNSKAIYKYFYIYKTSDGNTYSGYSLAINSPPIKGAFVILEYPKGNPSISRVKGPQPEFDPLWAYTSVFFFLFSVSSILYMTWHGLKAVHLLTVGQLGEGILKSKTTLSMMGTDGMYNAYRFKFEFTAKRGETYQVISETENPSVFQGEKKEKLVYDLSNPTRAIMLSGLPGSPKITEAGGVQLGDYGAAFLALMGPLLAILSNAIYLYSRFSGKS